MMNIIFIAPPAAGKGTQSKLISTEYNIPHISAGDLLRDEIASGSNMGKYLKEVMDHGELISDEMMVNLLRTRIHQVDCNNGYILDGYPRTLEQAKIYDSLMCELGKQVDLVILMNIDKDLALKRTLNRVVCSTCGTSYNQSDVSLMPKIDGFCDKCGHTLMVRTDDCEETFIHRFDTYLKETAPIIEYYRNKGILKEIMVREEDSTLDIFNQIKVFLDA